MATYDFSKKLTNPDGTVLQMQDLPGSAPRDYTAADVALLALNTDLHGDKVGNVAQDAYFASQRFEMARRIHAGPGAVNLSDAEKQLLLDRVERCFSWRGVSIAFLFRAAIEA